MTFLEEMMDHAAAEWPNECCGLVVETRAGKRCRLVRARNIARLPKIHFDLDPEAWLEVADDEDVIGIYHSHTVSPAEPSLADLSSCEASGLPWHIVAYPAGGYVRIEPSGFEAPYLRRPYVWGVHDCFSIIRDWYRRELSIEIPDFDRAPQLAGRDMYQEHYAEQGFVKLVDQVPQRGDVFLYRFGETAMSHAAVYLGDGVILHHPEGRLSMQDTYDGVWRRNVSAHLRHRCRPGIDHG